MNITSTMHVDADLLVSAHNGMVVCDAIERNAPRQKPVAMSAPNMPKVAGIDCTVPAPTQTVLLLDTPRHSSTPFRSRRARGFRTGRPAGFSDPTPSMNSPNAWPGPVSLDSALHELPRAGASLVGTRRGLILPTGAERGAVDRARRIGAALYGRAAAPYGRAHGPGLRPAAHGGGECPPRPPETIRERRRPRTAGSAACRAEAARPSETAEDFVLLAARFE